MEATTSVSSPRGTTARVSAGVAVGAPTGPTSPGILTGPRRNGPPTTSKKRVLRFIREIAPRDEGKRE
jgi:hypothetical protein